MKPFKWKDFSKFRKHMQSVLNPNQYASKLFITFKWNIGILYPDLKVLLAKPELSYVMHYVCRRHGILTTSPCGIGTFPKLA